MGRAASGGGDAGRRAWLAVVLLLGLAAGPAGAEAERASQTPRIYRWIDENGVTHYTTQLDRVPGALRTRAAPPPATSTGGVTRSGRAAADRWIERDRTVPLDDETWYEDEAPAPEDPAQIAARQEQRAEAQFDLDLRIAELQSEIAADEEALKTLISDPSAGGPLASADNPEFRTIAVRLPARLKELQALREQRASLGNAEPE